MTTEGKTESSWSHFYKDRVKSTYQNYFEKRYAPFLEFIRQQNNKYIIEMGCGIGSVSKALMKEGYICGGFDLSPEMVALANENCGKELFYVGDIFKEKVPVDLQTVTLGVLEHFDDFEIHRLCKENKHSIHYVPLNKYHKPSFGDERLLPYQHWLEVANPREWALFNDGFDLMFKV